MSWLSSQVSKSSRVLLSSELSVECRVSSERKGHGAESRERKLLFFPSSLDPFSPDPRPSSLLFHRSNRARQNSDNLIDQFDSLVDYFRREPVSKPFVSSSCFHAQSLLRCRESERIRLDSIDRRSIHHRGTEFTECRAMFIKSFFLRVLSASAVQSPICLSVSMSVTTSSNNRRAF
jgi:hypothetical protein